MNDVGVGMPCEPTCVRVYIANRPPMDSYQELECLRPLSPGEVYDIAQHTGNHWRKIFNVYAKFLFGWYSSQKELASNLHNAGRWQDFRDDTLLQAHSQSMLLFCVPDFEKHPADIHIIMGKQYAAQLGFDRDISQELTLLDRDFAICARKNLIICPYFDYRQLSNIKIDRLIELVNEMCKSPLK